MKIGLIFINTASHIERKIYMIKQFKDERHMNNYINYMCRLKGWQIDEAYDL
jgi:hypothetical protein